MIRAVACAVLVALGATVATAADRVVDLADVEAAGWLRTEHYGIFRGDRRIGRLRRDLVRAEKDGVAVVVRTMEQFVDVAGDGNGLHILERATYRADAPQDLLRLERSTERQGVVNARVVVRTEGRFDVTTTRAGETTTGAVVAFPIVLADELVLERLVAAARANDGGPVGTTERAIGLDIGRMRPLRRILSVRGVEGDGAAPVFLVGVATGPDTWSDPLRVDATGSIVTGPLDGQSTISRMSAEEAQSKVGQSSLEETLRVPLDAPLGDLRTATSLRVALSGAPDAPCPFAETGRQEVREDEGRRVVTVRAGHDSGEVTEAERAAALAPSPGIDCDHASIVAAVARVLAGTSQRAPQVARLLEFTRVTVEDMVVLTEPSASEILERPRGDCSEHTRLFVALCRASGIPAREVVGLAWMGDDVRAFGRDAWAEVELAGKWREVDPTEGRMPADVAHLRLVPDVGAEIGGLELLAITR